MKPEHEGSTDPVSGASSGGGPAQGSTQGSSQDSSQGPPSRQPGAGPESPAPGPATPDGPGDPDLADPLPPEVVEAEEIEADVLDAVEEAEAVESHPGEESEVAADVADAVEGIETADDPLAAAEAALVERTQDLQRLQAEFVNYKRRVDRDRELLKQNATYEALVPIVDVLDTIDRAREHGEVEGGFKAVADQLERTVATAGLVKFGEPGDAFDPTVHEALSHTGEDPGIEVTTCTVVAKAGYKIGDRVVRAAQVLVADPPS